MEYILNTIVSLVSFIGGVCFCTLLIFIMIGLPGSIFYTGFPWGFVMYICMLTLIYGILLRIIYIKFGLKIVRLSICIFIAGIVVGPTFLINFHNIMGF